MAKNTPTKGAKQAAKQVSKQDKAQNTPTSKNKKLATVEKVESKAGTPTKSKGTPTKTTPSKPTAAKSTPSKHTPSKTPTKTPPAKSKATQTATKGTSSKSTPSKSTPSKSTPSKSTPSKATPSKPVSEKAASLKTVSAKSTPTNTPAKSQAKTSKVSKNDGINHVPRPRITKAIAALSKYTNQSNESEKDSNNLLDGDDLELRQKVHLIAINPQYFQDSKLSFKLKMINVKHSLYKPWKESSVNSIRDFKTLLILRDADREKVSKEQLMEALQGSDIVIDEIVSGNDFKTTYKAYEARRAFLSDFSLILADESIITALPKLLGGKAWNKTETTPIGIRTQSAKKFSLVTLTNSVKRTYLTLLPIKIPRGTTLNAHLGNLDWFSASELADNVSCVTDYLLSKYKISAIFLKTNDSPVVPIYNDNKIVAKLDSDKSQKKESEIELVEIDGVQVPLSSYDRALVAIANPSELKNIFRSKIERVKRKRDEGEADGNHENKKKAKTAKKAEA